MSCRLLYRRDLAEPGSRAEPGDAEVGKAGRAPGGLTPKRAQAPGRSIPNCRWRGLAEVLVGATWQRCRVHFMDGRDAPTFPRPGRPAARRRRPRPGQPQRTRAAGRRASGLTRGTPRCESPCELLVASGSPVAQVVRARPRGTRRTWYRAWASGSSSKITSSLFSSELAGRGLPELSETSSDAYRRLPPPYSPPPSHCRPFSVPLRSPDAWPASQAGAQNAHRDEPFDILSAEITIHVY